MSKFIIKVARTYVTDLEVTANTTADAVDKVISSINNCTHYHNELVKEVNGSNEVLRIAVREEDWEHE